MAERQLAEKRRNPHTDRSARTTDRFEGTKKVASAVLRGVNTALQTVACKAARSARSAARPMRGIEGVWEFRVQLCRDLATQPIEDPTVEWSEADAPSLRIGTITVPAQDSWERQRVDAVDERMRFSVWTGLAAHQPLGNINRARKAPCRHSAEFRERFNACPIHEPSS